MGKLQGKVIVITGATSGIGKALAIECGRRGARVVVTGRNADRLKEIESRLTADGVDTLALLSDVTSEEDAKALAQATVDRFGGIDVLINNAGISMRALFAEVNLDVIRQVMDINFWGTVHCTKYALPYILGAKGSVVGMSSIAGYKGLPGRTGYSASKFAMHGFLESLRCENLNNGLHVLIACPGFTASNIRMSALTADGSQQGASPRNEQKMMTAEEVAVCVADAIEKRRRKLVLTTDGKLTVLLGKFFPAWLDKMVLKHFAKEES
ncbi:MAG: SDR family oxidoreductase [Flavobacteriales bacterium]|nr:SDR family oxidoreductase [Flavobacteriales bacterium]MCB9448157.1 SDR family oxidoreductase [Flavobacteriales bacterium]